jgi:carbon-monoxide dehydrogenase large subunit
MAGLLGTSVNRREDRVLLTGHAHYTGDISIAGCLGAHFVRSAFAHARSESIDCSTAATMPGVVAVFTNETLGLGPTTSRMPIADELRRTPLAADRVRYVGEPVACVIATSEALAADAAEAVVIDYDPLDTVVDMMDALEPNDVILHPSIGANVLWVVGPDEPDLHDKADIIVTGRYENTRMAVSPIEPYALTVRPDAGGHLTVWYSCQGGHAIRDGLAASLGLDSTQVRVIVPWVGGGFGAKGVWNPEHVTVARAAQLTGRPVRWVERRSENLLSMHGRAQVQFARMGVRNDARIVSFEAFVVSDAGAHLVAGGFLPTATRLMAQGCYRIARVKFDHAVAFTNTTPLLAFRGAGRPEAAALIERTVDLAARELGIDPLEFRRRNFVQPDEFPFTTETGAVYDTGEYERSLDLAAREVGYHALRSEQQRRRDRHDRIVLGIGVASYVEITGGFSPREYGSAAIDDDGSVTISVGTQSHGQGHETTFCALASDLLGIPFDQVRFVQGDTDLVPRGAGTGGSRSAQIGGSAISAACAQLIEQARRLAAGIFEADVRDVVQLDGGLFGVAGVPSRSVGWADLAISTERSATASHREDPLFACADFDQAGATYPFGTHISVVEVDTETGRIEIVRHVAVDDAGIILNPAIVEGQQHGGIAAGIAQALWERVVYDAAGNPLNTNFAEYGIPSAAELPSFDVRTTVTPTHMNPLGVKGIGEAGTIGATPAIQNAVIDALAHLGVTHIDMPLTTERVWRSIVDASRGLDALPTPEWPRVSRR